MSDGIFIDDATEEAPLVPRIKTGGNDAEQVMLQNQQKLSILTPAQRAGMTIPTPQETSRSGVTGDFAEMGTGLSQDQIDVSRLSEELGTLQAQEAKLIAQGSFVPTTLRNAIRAKANSIDFQMQAMRNTTPDPVAVEFKQDQELLLKAYEKDMESAVLRMQRDKRVNKQHAEELVLRKIKTFGNAEILPQFASIAARMALKYPDSNS